MNWTHAWLVFRKDAIEVLRDRRTLFINVILPVLLYPLITLFLIQIAQVAQLDPPAPPRLLLIDAPPNLSERFPAAAATPAARSASSASSAPAATQRPVLVGATLSASAAHDLRGALRRWQEARFDAVLGQTTFDPHNPTPASPGSAHPDEPLSAPDTTASPNVVSPNTTPPSTASSARAGPTTGAGSASRASEAERRAAVTALLHRHDAVAVLWCIQAPGRSDRYQVVLAIDDAHPRRAQSEQRIYEVLRSWRAELQRDRMRAAGVAIDDTVELSSGNVADPVDSGRSGLALILPVLLILIAISGVLVPATDLIAGERERGTLETLLAWPGDRRAVVLGKLGVVIAAAIATVALNLCSLGATVSVLSGIAGRGGGDIGEGNALFAGLIAAGPSALALALLVLLPVVVTLAGAALAVTGTCASLREAQAAATPLLLIAMVAAGAAMIPDLRPSFALDLIPITGPAVVLRECLQARDIPWGHLLLSSAASLAIAWIVVGWTARLFDRESFRYPGLVRAGWGRFRRFATSPPVPGGLEALAVFACAFGLFAACGSALAAAPAAAKIAVPLLIAIGLPPLLHAWLGGYRARDLGLGTPSARGLLCGVLAIPGGLALSFGLGMLQGFVLPTPADGGASSEFLRTWRELEESLGPVWLVVLVSVTPGLCEELLCRGTLLHGLRQSLGVRSAVILSAFLFACLHLSPYRFFPQGALGLVLALLVLRSGSLWPAVILHTGHNALAVGVSTFADLQHLSPAKTALIGSFATATGILWCWLCVRLAMNRAPDRKGEPSFAAAARRNAP